MEIKYQEALDMQKESLSIFHKRCNSEVPKSEVDRWNTLQELINNYKNLREHIYHIENNDMDNAEKWETLLSILEGEQ